MTVASSPSAGLAAQDRRDQIAELVDEGQRVSVADLRARFGVTDASIRRDLTLLENAGRIQRIHGGAVSLSANLGVGVYGTKIRLRREEKARIGGAAARFIQPGDVVLFDSGTTVAQVAARAPRSLRVGGAITAVTYSLPVIEEIGGWDSPHLVCLGGLYLPDYRAFVGPQTIAALRELTAEVVFLGCDGLTVENGLTTTHILVAEVASAATTRARRVVALADSSKLGRQGFTPIVALSDVDLLITDSGADAAIVAGIRRAGVEVVLA